MAANADMFRILPQTIMTTVYTVGYFVTLVMMLTGRIDVPAEHIGLVTTVIGVLTGAQTMILAYWFGSGPNETNGK